MLLLVALGMGVVVVIAFRDFRELTIMQARRSAVLVASLLLSTFAFFSPPGTGVANAQDGPVVCSWIDTGSGFDVSWDAYPGADKYVVNRTVDDGRSRRRGTVTDGSLSFTGDRYPKRGGSVAYSVTVKDGANSVIAEGDCTNTDGTTGSCAYSPLTPGLVFQLDLDWSQLDVTPETFVIQQSLDAGPWTDEAELAVTLSGYTIPIPEGAESSWEYRVEARDSMGVPLDTVDCELDPTPGLNLDPDGSILGLPIKDENGSSYPLQISQQGAANYEAITKNDCSFDSDWTLADWETGASVVLPRGRKLSVEYAFWLPHAPEGYVYQVWMDTQVATIGQKPSWSGGENTYHVMMRDANGWQINSINGFVFDDKPRTYSAWGDETTSGKFFLSGGYMTMRVTNNWSIKTAGVQFKVGGSGNYAIHLIPKEDVGFVYYENLGFGVGNPIAFEDRHNYPTVTPPPNPCLALYGPEAAGLYANRINEVPGLDLSEWGNLGIALEVWMWVEDNAIEFAPGYDCADAIVNGITPSNSAFCLADVVSGGLAGSADEAALLLRNSSDMSLRFRKGDDELIDIFGISSVEDATRACWRSFASTTPVLKADGTSQAIGSLQAGDIVLGYDPDTGTYKHVPITDVHPHTDRLYPFTYGSGTIWTTEDHRRPPILEQRQRRMGRNPRPQSHRPAPWNKRHRTQTARNRHLSRIPGQGIRPNRRPNPQLLRNQLSRSSCTSPQLHSLQSV